MADPKVENIDNLSVLIRAGEGLKGGFYSDNFVCGGREWRLLYHPDGFQLYLVAVFPETTKDRRENVKFALTIKSHGKGKPITFKSSPHTFTPDEIDWGTKKIAEAQALYDPENGYLKDGYLDVNVQIFSNFGLAPKEEEIGILESATQGNPCSLYFLVQTLFHLPSFRTSVYELPPKDATALNTLQEIFFELATDCSPSSSIEQLLAFLQIENNDLPLIDVAELNQVLLDTLETKMKGTPMEGTIKKLFQGSVANYTECIDISYSSEKVENFYDLQMPVEGCKSIYDSFRKYVSPSLLSGENQYHALGYGLQDAYQGVRFKTFPDVLGLNLIRFKEDFFNGQRELISSRFEFYPLIDLKGFFDPSDSNTSVYRLQGVLVRMGSREKEKSCAFFRPIGGPEWSRFDGSSVVKTTTKGAIYNNFGGVENAPYAYRLIYIRDSKAKELSKAGEIPSSVRERFDGIVVGVVTQELLFKIGSQEWDMIDDAKIPKVKVKGDMALRQFRDKYANENGICNPDKIRVWEFRQRKNQTNRVSSSKLDTKLESAQKTKKGSIVKLFFEVSNRKIAPFFDDTKPTIIFFKYFDATNQCYRHVGHALFRPSDRVKSFAQVARRMSGIPNSVGISFLEERKENRRVLLAPEKTLQLAGLISGDIVIIERANKESTEVVIQFRPMSKPLEEGFSLLLNENMGCMEIAKRVGEKIGCPACFVGLFNNSKETGNSPFETGTLLYEMIKTSCPASTLYVKRMETDLYQEGDQCVICMNGPKDTMLLHLKKDVGHTCVCGKCAVELKEKKGLCPICREPIDAVVRSY